MSYPAPQQQRSRQRSRGVSPITLRLLIAGGIVLFSVITFLTNTDTNPVTGEKQRIGNLTVKDEIRMGWSAVRDMAAQHNGPSRDVQATRNVQEMGTRLVDSLQQNLERQGKVLPYPFDFHLLADRQVVNAFALPGGQVFITEALYQKMTHAGQLAGVLGHEIGHVLERHSAQRMAKGGLINGIVGAAGVAGGDVSSANAAALVGNMINMSYGQPACANFPLLSFKGQAFK